jgi:hypothetical protein
MGEGGSTQRSSDYSLSWFSHGERRLRRQSDPPQKGSLQIQLRAEKR